MIKKEKRPWGEFEIIHQKPGLTIKIITVNSNQRLSLQSHQLRDEVWLLLDGELFWEKGDEMEKMLKGIAVLIPKKYKHRLSAGHWGGRVLEVSFGKFNEKDIERFEDDYNRV